MHPSQSIHQLISISISHSSGHGFYNSYPHPCTHVSPIHIQLYPHIPSPSRSGGLHGPVPHASSSCLSFLALDHLRLLALLVTPVQPRLSQVHYHSPPFEYLFDTPLTFHNNPHDKQEQIINQFYRTLVYRLPNNIANRPTLIMSSNPTTYCVVNFQLTIPYGKCGNCWCTFDPNPPLTLTHIITLF
ncbi:hypothetical protein BDN72DRAFT_274319 [Pluteus cervinus]|uniref:Uncharacterized protein n=1 Tax=Pluteus cervinus TaxID=181527 RepID=A0ACD3AEJ3_9AGAR|nr:hypothetical protein BDN72DRAFT_274319 [Pluteus cervinus]